MFVETGCRGGGGPIVELSSACGPEILSFGIVLRSLSMDTAGSIDSNGSGDLVCGSDTSSGVRWEGIGNGTTLSLLLNSSLIEMT
mmetsp:Transcript_9006/g.10759  ORF Transcript_9006/g.10759 Transcript_9006/m.10759 type:complete len:85 (+) Transcript_9006:190-444(+)